jgi:putative glutamine amidotransferase
VIEAIEVPGQRFAMGVEWHPAFLLGPLDRAVMGALVAAAKQTKLA